MNRLISSITSSFQNRIVRYVLNKTLSPYLILSSPSSGGGGGGVDGTSTSPNVDGNSTNIDVDLHLYDGILTLTNLFLNCSELNSNPSLLGHPNCPFEVVGGCGCGSGNGSKVGKVIVKVPWDDLLNQRTVLRVEDVTIILQAKKDFFRKKQKQKKRQKNENQSQTFELLSSFHLEASEEDGSASVWSEDGDSDSGLGSLSAFFVDDDDTDGGGGGGETDSDDDDTASLPSGSQSHLDMDSKYIFEILNRLLANISIEIVNVQIEVRIDLDFANYLLTPKDVHEERREVPEVPETPPMPIPSPTVPKRELKLNFVIPKATYRDLTRRVDEEDGCGSGRGELIYDYSLELSRMLLRMYSCQNENSSLILESWLGVKEIGVMMWPSKQQKERRRRRKGKGKGKGNRKVPETGGDSIGGHGDDDQNGNGGKIEFRVNVGSCGVVTRHSFVSGQRTGVGNESGSEFEEFEEPGDGDFILSVRSLIRFVKGLVMIASPSSSSSPSSPETFETPHDPDDIPLPLDDVVNPGDDSGFASMTSASGEEDLTAFKSMTFSGDSGRTRPIRPGFEMAHDDVAVAQLLGASRLAMEIDEGVSDYSESESDDDDDMIFHSLGPSDADLARAVSGTPDAGDDDDLLDSELEVGADGKESLKFDLDEDLREMNEDSMGSGFRFRDFESGSSRGGSRRRRRAHRRRRGDSESNSNSHSRSAFSLKCSIEKVAVDIVYDVDVFGSGGFVPFRSTDEMWTLEEDGIQILQSHAHWHIEGLGVEASDSAHESVLNLSIAGINLSERIRGRDRMDDDFDEIALIAFGPEKVSLDLRLDKRENSLTTSLSLGTVSMSLDAGAIRHLLLLIAPYVMHTPESSAEKPLHELTGAAFGERFVSGLTTRRGGDSLSLSGSGSRSSSLYGYGSQVPSTTRASDPPSVPLSAKAKIDVNALYIIATTPSIPGKSLCFRLDGVVVELSKNERGSDATGMIRGIFVSFDEKKPTSMAEGPGAAVADDGWQEWDDTEPHSRPSRRRSGLFVGLGSEVVRHRIVSIPRTDFSVTLKNEVAALEDIARDETNQRQRDEGLEELEDEDDSDAWAEEEGEDEADMFSMKRKNDRKVEDYRRVSSALVRIVLSTGTIRVDVVQSKVEEVWAFCFDFYDTTVAIMTGHDEEDEEDEPEEGPITPENPLSPYVLQFLYNLFDPTQNLIPAISLQLQVSEIVIAGEILETQLYSSLKGLEAIVLIHFEPYSVTRLKLDLEEVDLFVNDRPFIRGTSKLVKPYRENRDCVIVDLLMRSDSKTLGEILTLTDSKQRLGNILMKIQLNGMYLSIVRDLDWIFFLIGLIPPGKAPRTRFSILSVYLALHDTIIDVSPPPPSGPPADDEEQLRSDLPRCLLAIDCVKFETRMLQRDDHYHVILHVENASLLIHPGCGTDLVNYYISGADPERKQFGLFNCLGHRGFVRMAGAYRLGVDIVSLRINDPTYTGDEPIPTRERPPLRVVIARGGVFVSCCADSIEVVLRLAEQLQESFATFELPQMPNKDGEEEEEEEEGEVVPSSEFDVLVQLDDLPLEDEDDRPEPSLVSSATLSSSQFPTMERIQRHEDYAIIIHDAFDKKHIDSDFFALPSSVDVKPTLSVAYPVPSMEFLVHRKFGVTVELFGGRDFPRSDDEPSRSKNSIRINLTDVFARFVLFPVDSSHFFMGRIGIGDINIHDRVESSSRNMMVSYLKEKRRRRIQGSRMVDLFVDCERRRVEEKLFNVSSQETTAPSSPVVEEKLFNVSLDFLPARVNIHQKTLYFALVYALNLVGLHKVKTGAVEPPLPPESEFALLGGEEEEEGESPPPITEDRTENDTASAAVDAVSALDTLKFKSFRVGPLKLVVDVVGSKQFDAELVSAVFEEASFLMKTANVIFNFFSMKDFTLEIGGYQSFTVMARDELVSVLSSHYLREFRLTKLFPLVLQLLPLQRVVTVTEKMMDVFVIPIRELGRGDEGHFFRGLRRGVQSFVAALARESVGFGAEASGTAADWMQAVNDSIVSEVAVSDESQPENVVEGARDAVRSVARGARTAYYAMVAIPRAYESGGASGVAGATLRALPVGVLAPVSGLADGVSKLLFGVQNAWFPTLREQHDIKYKKKRH